VGESSVRVVAVDALRGLAVAGMLAVNNAGLAAGEHPQIAHAEWHGLTAADVVFPLFLFVVGTSVVLATRDGERVAWSRVVRRTLVLFALGLLLAAVPDPAPATLRLPGVLQRIALVYLAAVAVVRLLPAWAQRVLLAALLLGHWAVLSLVPAPGGQAGDLTREGNVAGAIDRAVLGEAHLHRGGPVDPEGLLGTVPSVATALAGVEAGRALRRRRADAAVPGGLVAAGAAAIVGGALWSAALPVNKVLWTGSFVLVTAGIGLGLLGVGALAERARPGRALLWPWQVLGRNALVVYVAAELVRKSGAWWGPQLEGRTLNPHAWLVAWLPGDAMTGLAVPAGAVLAWWAVSAMLHRARIYVRL
jgi:predicted acyltransferase